MYVGRAQTGAYIHASVYDMSYISLQLCEFPTANSNFCPGTDVDQHRDPFLPDLGRSFDLGQSR